MIADHYKKYRQGQVVIVQGSGKCIFPFLWIRFASCFRCLYHCFLCGYDEEENICHHQCAEHCPEVHICCPCIEHTAIEISERGCHQKTDQGKQHRPFNQG